MKKILVLAATLVLVSSSAFAALTATLDVTATVQTTCSVTGGTLAFGAIDPVFNTSDITKSAAGVTVTCTTGTAYTVSDDAASNPLTDGATGSIPFALSYPSGNTGVGTAAAQPIAIDGTILVAGFATAPAGAYTSTVTLTVAP